MIFKRFNVLLLAFLLLFAGYTQLYASEISETLNSVQTLIKEKNYTSAQRLLIDKLKTNRNSYKLWLALGYVYEADENYAKALKAFMLASELKTNIPGLTDRILRLQQVVKTQKKREDAETSSQSLFERARYQIAFGQKLEGYKTLYQAIELDRSILSSDHGLVSQALQYFKNNKSKYEDADFYIGAFQYYSGYYNQSVETFVNYIAESKPTGKSKEAQHLLDESRQVLAQIKSRERQLAMARKAAKEKEKEKPSEEDTKKLASIPKAEVKSKVDYSKYNKDVPKPKPGEKYAVTLAKSRAMNLLSEFDSTNDRKRKMKILWRFGDNGIPFPEIMQRFAYILVSDDREMIIAALDSLGKIGMPGAKICGPYLVPLLEKKDNLIKWFTINILRKVPVLPDKVIPKLVELYQKESITHRQSRIINAIYAYGNSGTEILRTMLEEALGPNKRPIAEILSIITGEDVEELIRNS